MVNKYLNNILIQTSKILGCEVGIIEGNGTVVSASGINEISMNVSDVIDASGKRFRKYSSFSR